MKITQNKVVSMQYQISEPNGEVLEASEPGDEWWFLVGADQVPPGLEKALQGHEVGDSLSVTLAPADGYGEREEALVQTLKKSDLGEDIDVEVGDQLEATTGDDEDDSVDIVQVVAVTDDSITVDGNHILAGKTLKFDIKVLEVRDATEEELEHGHAHGDHCMDDDWDDDDDDWDDAEPLAGEDEKA